MKNVFKIAILPGIITLTLFLFACEKNDYTDYKMISDEFKVILSREEDKVKITWTLIKSNNFHSYRIYRVSNPNQYDYWQRDEFIIGVEDDKHQLTFIDQNPVYLGNNYYWVEIMNQSGFVIKKSSIELINISDFTSFDNFPINPIFNKTENLIGFNSDFYFTLYNFEKDSVIGTIPIYSNEAYPAFGIYEGKNELYFPADNQIVILDASTLETISHIPLPESTNNRIRSISTNDNGTIYVTKRYQYGILAIDRATGLVSTHTNYSLYGDEYLAYSKNLNRILAVSTSYSRLRFYLFSLKPDGSIDPNQYVSNNSVSGYFFPYFKIDPYNDHLIILPDNILYSLETLVYESNSISLKLNDICFAEGYSYSAPVNQKKIIKRDKNNNLIHTYETKGYPVYVFATETKLVVFFVNETIEETIYYDRHQKGYPLSTPFGIQIIEL